MGTHHYRAPDGEFWRVTVEPDPDAMSPRDASNVCVMKFPPQCRYVGPDHGYVKAVDMPRIEFIGDNGLIDMRRFSRYVNLFCSDLGIVAMAGLSIRHDWAPTLILGLFETDADAMAEYDGAIFIMRQSWAECMGADYPVSSGAIENAMRDEVDAYNRWAGGYFVQYETERYVLWSDSAGRTRGMWELVDSCGSIDCGSDEYGWAWDEAEANLPDGSVSIDSNDIPEGNE
jgi:hypothetical protein